MATRPYTSSCAIPLDACTCCDSTTPAPPPPSPPPHSALTVVAAVAAVVVVAVVAAEAAAEQAEAVQRSRTWRRGAERAKNAQQPSYCCRRSAWWPSHKADTSVSLMSALIIADE